MDAYQQSYRYLRPPPPPPPQPWYPGQFQFQPPRPSVTHQPHLWGLPSHSDQAPPSGYAPPSYQQHPPPQQPFHNQCHRLPMPPHRYQQEHGSTVWGHHQGWDWEHPAQNNEEDWAARARAWAAAKAAMDNQPAQPQAQFTPVSWPEEHIHQFSQSVNAHYLEAHQQSLSPSSYQQFPVSAGPPPQLPGCHSWESASVSLGQSSYAEDVHLSRDATSTGDTSAVFPYRQRLSSPIVHQQEVPSSYSSIAGQGECIDPMEHLHKSLSFPTSTIRAGRHQSLFAGAGIPVSLERPFAYGSRSTSHTMELADEPLEFAPRISHDRSQNLHSNYLHVDSAGPVRVMDPVAVVPSVHNWTPSAPPGLVYPPIPSVLPSGTQHDPSIAVHSPVLSHAAPPFGKISGPSIQSTIPPVGAPFTLGTATSLHPATALPGDSYGVPNYSERPKKAAVPNWLREEIIKKKAVMGTSAHEQPQEESQSIEDEGVDKSLGKGNQADSKSVDSSRSTEEEDEDEDYMDAAKTAALNQEIKRILTEVLLKVTDELFDEIATKILSEDDMTAKVDQNTAPANCRDSSSPSAGPASKSSAKILIPVKSVETKMENASGKSDSFSPGDVLGLASYASDDENDVVQTSNTQHSGKNDVICESNIKSHLEFVSDATENGNLPAEVNEQSREPVDVGDDICRTSTTEVKSGNDARVNKTEGRSFSFKHFSKAVSGGKGDVLNNSVNSVQEKAVKEAQLPDENFNARKNVVDDPQIKQIKSKSDKYDGCEAKENSSRKDSCKEVEKDMGKVDEKGNENNGNKAPDGRHLRRENTDDQNGLKEKKKEHDRMPDERSNQLIKKMTHSDVKENRKETEKGKRVGVKEEIDKRRVREGDEKDDKSRHKPVNDSSRHKRRCSPVFSTVGRHSMDDSNDENTEDSRRKQHPRRRNISPSPVRSRKRQITRSPPSKHSQRRHSPYSTLEMNRRSTGRSGSPIRRHR